MGGVIGLTLTACTTDTIVDDLDQQNAETGSQYQTNSYNPNNPGYYNPGSGIPAIVGDNYYSPWDIKHRNDVIPTYTISNHTAGEGYSIFELHLTPYIGVAYYDGVNDGQYHDAYQASLNPPGLVADFTNGNYPNLYQNGNEIGELITAEPIILDGSSINHSEVSISSYADHCPVNPHTPGSSPGWNPENRFFDISNNATPQEKAVLARYGKVFFYEYTVILKSNGSVVGNGFIQVQNKTIQDPATYPYWEDTFVTNAFVPGKGNVGKLRYYHETDPLIAPSPFTSWVPNLQPNDPTVWCDSREVDYEFEWSHEEYFFGYPSHKISLYMGMGANLWMTSGHVISIGL
ncbi:hypothetical protein [Paenimyroides aestuarii]|uniref:Uncharacterized protein n=1 Tax=Paenimyroides aestuarii TaxID=2968490 RepID=A0ABY5NUL0_9FLAO|nr:hypothetical protein [Paenimyroides aestuarii]UUV22285.1 hypothetical protein NPX36_04405 [Paenimyroides aestuarii]